MFTITIGTVMLSAAKHDSTDFGRKNSLLRPYTSIEP
jgi:hypothetical protein